MKKSILISAAAALTLQIAAQGKYTIMAICKTQRGRRYTSLLEILATQKSTALLLPMVSSPFKVRCKGLLKVALCLWATSMTTET